MSVWPQIVYIILSSIGVAFSLCRWALDQEHGASVSLSIVWCGFINWLLYMGGFYNVFLQ